LPGLLDLPDEIVPDYFRSYIQTYVERDIRLLENIRELTAFDRFLGLSAALCGQEINSSQLGREIGITPATSRRWLDLLENTFQWLELYPYHGNTIKRVSGKRKGFWRDTGITCYLQRISSPEALAVSPLRGALFEAWVVNSIYRLSSLLATPPHLYHWRTAGGAEVDLILELDGRLFPIEVKCKTTLTKHDTRGLRAFRETYGQDKVAPGVIVYAGHECYRVDPFTIAIPWNTLHDSEQ
jgi:predicted AAA+ superfamily ATPase